MRNRPDEAKSRDPTISSRQIALSNVHPTECTELSVCLGPLRSARDIAREYPDSSTDDVSQAHIAGSGNGQGLAEARGQGCWSRGVATPQLQTQVGQRDDLALGAVSWAIRPAKSAAPKLRDFTLAVVDRDLAVVRLRPVGAMLELTSVG